MDSDTTFLPPTSTHALGAMMIAPFWSVLEQHVGAAARDEAFASVGLELMPGDNEMVPEAKVAALHEQIRESWPGADTQIFDEAGRVAAEMFVVSAVSPQARLLLQNMPFSMAAWLVGKSVRLNAAQFTGSGLFAIQTTSRLAIYKNPLVGPRHPGARTCVFYAAFFEHLFQRLAHRDFTCSETSCCAEGSDHCTFQLKM